MPSAQLRALVVSLIEPIEDPALADPSIAIGTRCDADDVTSAAARGAPFAVDATPIEIRIGHRVPIGVVNGVSLGHVDLDAPLDCGPSSRTPRRPDTASDSPSLVAPLNAIDPTGHVIDHAIVALDALDDAIDIAFDDELADAINSDLDGDRDDGLDDFEAQPTAYRVRTSTLDDAIASPAPR